MNSTPVTIINTTIGSSKKVMPDYCERSKRFRDAARRRTQRYSGGQWTDLDKKGPN
jgi:hypothetical protein